MSNLRSGGDMSLKSRYLGSRRPGDAENFVRFQKKWGEKKNTGCPISIFFEKMGCKVAKHERTPDQGDDEDALHYIQQQKNRIQQKGKNGGKKKDARNEAFSCPGIFSRTLHFMRAASGGALAPEPAAHHRGRTRLPTDFSSLLPVFPVFF